MKKSTLYTLLCTTIMIPSIALAAEQTDKKDDTSKPPVHSTPIRGAIPNRLLSSSVVVDSPLKTDTPTKLAEQETKEAKKTAKTLTPLKEEEKQRLRDTTGLDEEDVVAFGERAAVGRLAEEQRLLQIKLREIEAKKSQTILERRLQKEERKREKQAAEQDKLIESAKHGATQELTLQIEDLTQKLELVQKEISELAKEKLTLQEQHRTEKEALQKSLDEKVQKAQVSKEHALKMLQEKEVLYEARLADIDRAERAHMKTLDDLATQKQLTETEMLSNKKFEKAFREMGGTQSSGAATSALVSASHTSQVPIVKGAVKPSDDRSKVLVAETLPVQSTTAVTLPVSLPPQLPTELQSSVPVNLQASVDTAVDDEDEEAVPVINFKAAALAMKKDEKK